MNKKIEGSQTYLVGETRYAACGDCNGGYKRKATTGDETQDFMSARCPVFELGILPKIHKVWEQSKNNVDKAVEIALAIREKTYAYDDGGVYHFFQKLQEKHETFDIKKFKELSDDTKALLMMVAITKKAAALGGL